MYQKFFLNYYDEIYKSLLQINNKDKLKALNIIKKLKSKNKIIFVGNGGSSSISSHCATDFNKILKKRSITFNDTNLITCYANDYGHENWMSEAVKSFGDKGDILILISSSGKSKNILNCAKTAKKRGLKIITFSGFSKNNRLKKMGHINFWVNSKKYNIIEMTHHIWIVSFCDYLSLKR